MKRSEGGTLRVNNTETRTRPSLTRLVSRRIKDMHQYTKQELDRLWWNMTTEQRRNHQIWYAFCEAYKNAPNYDY